ncbi:MAG TPA: phosphatase PAP2 family protein [Acidimicrobiia bacterium]|nr:phosphatase PAP2 family protein [Acidimicrobiia bacterium]
MNLGDRVAAFDAAVDRGFDRIRSPAVDRIAYRLSSAADHSLLWHSIGAARALFHGRDFEHAARFSLALGAESAITNGLLKSVFRRVRPVEYSELEFPHGLRRPITSSFPSGHATAAFCAATMFGGGPLWYGAAATVAATRVYVRLHHASDVLAGAAIGVALGLALRPVVGGAFVRRGE